MSNLLPCESKAAEFLRRRQGIERPQSRRAFSARLKEAKKK
ncbi:hypothetical protein [Amycolatopsis sp. NBRC 101858]|nr:hypothetical protein [Amycolatopsis sp. NBRC 101858]